MSLRKEYKPSTVDVLRVVGTFSKETVGYLNNPKDVDHTCPERQRLRESNPIPIAAAANDAGKDIPLNSSSGKAFREQAKLEVKEVSMTPAEQYRNTACESLIIQGFRERAQNLEEQAAKMDQSGVLTKEDAQKVKEEIAYNRGGVIIHTGIITAKSLSLPAPDGSITTDPIDQQLAVQKKLAETEAELRQELDVDLPQSESGNGCRLM